MNQLMQIGLLISVFVAVASLVLFTMDRLQVFGTIQRRLAGERRAKSSTQSIIKRQGVTHPLLAWVQASTLQTNQEDHRKLARTLRQAGFDHSTAPIWFVIIRLALAIGLPMLFLFSQTLSGDPITGPKLIFIALFICGVGFITPQATIDRTATQRRTRLEHEFPDALDLMVVCVEAGLGMEAAFVRVGEEIAESHPLMARQFDMVSQELRAGRRRPEALRNFAERADVSAIRSFVALLIQTDNLGTSIAQTLRTYSQEMRETRLVKAEEKAMRIPVLMTIPLVACILPVVIAALMLPAGIEVAHSLLPALNGIGGQ